MKVFSSYLKGKPRFDRLLTQYCFGPLSTRFGSHHLRIPILMYHSISNDIETRHPYYWINTSPARFTEQMQYLHDWGYHVLSLSQAAEVIRVHGLSCTAAHPCCASKHVVLTFDDGYSDFYAHAFPVLDRYGFTATVFLPTAYIGNEKIGLRGKRHLTWDQVTDLTNQGITFGSHTVSHPQLSRLDKREILYELQESKEIIEEKTGQNGITSFCYPYRFPDRDRGFRVLLNECLSKVGYESCVTTRIGSSNTAKDILCLKRLPINTGDDRSLFLAKLNGCYDWLSGLQSLIKTIKRPYESARSHRTR